MPVPRERLHPHASSSQETFDFFYHPAFPGINGGNRDPESPGHKLRRQAFIEEPIVSFPVLRGKYGKCQPRRERAGILTPELPQSSEVVFDKGKENRKVVINCP